MSDTIKSYDPLTEDQFNKLWKKHERIISQFIKMNGYDDAIIGINRKDIYSIIAKVDQRRQYFRYYHRLEMSEFKETALICYWYIKLKPLSISSKDENAWKKAEFDAINEKLAVFYILSTFRKVLTESRKPTDVLDSLPDTYLSELIYSFEYRDISKEALTLLIESIAVFLGLQPYQ